MKKSYVVIGLLLLTFAGPRGGEGRAFGGPLLAARGGHGMMGSGPPGMLFPQLLRGLDLSAAQKAQVADIMARHRAKLDPIFTQLRSAHEDIASKLLSSGAVTAADLAPSIERLGKLKQQLLQEWMQAALETRAVLTPAQLAKAAEVKQRLDSLRGEMQKLLGPSSMPPDGADE